MDINKLRKGQRIRLLRDLPRVQHPNGDIKPVVRNTKIEANIVALKAGAGKQIGVELDAPGKNLEWYDAHECDGAAPMKFGWWTRVENIELVKE